MSKGSHDEDMDYLVFGDDGGCINILSFSRRFFVDNVSDGDPITVNPLSASKKDIIKGHFSYSKVTLHQSIRHC